jgi:hypothetical protein
MLRSISAALFLISILTLYDVCSPFSYIFCFGLHDIECVLDGGEVRRSKCFVNRGQCPLDYGPHVVCRHGLSLRAVDRIQRTTKILGEFGSVTRTGVVAEVVIVASCSAGFTDLACQDGEPHRFIVLLQR